MKIKTSVSLSSEVLVQVNQFADEGERSDFVEKALWKYIASLQRQKRDQRDLQKINHSADFLNDEAKDVLSYQVRL